MPHVTDSPNNEGVLRALPGSLPGRWVSPPHLRAAGRSPNNLPLELSSFIGREREIEEIKRLLFGGARLLTLAGPGGCGKTRLALEVAAELVGGFEDGVWLVELASLSDPTLVPQAVASVLRVREQAGRPLTETLSNHLESKKMLLVLDNCEHLIEECANLAEALLRTCPGLRVLATSREALSITGETNWPVSPLSLPDAHDLPPIEELTRYEATRLFVERSVAVLPAFGLTSRNALAVAQVCQKLDGIPLAIELAAARVRVLTAEQIAERLDDCFWLLRGGSRTALPRHRTLRATIDWSHELLSEEERALFRRLSVFAGGSTLEAAEAACGGEDLEKDEILEPLSHLVDKSLVVMEERGGEARYRLLETVRQYGREKLRESGEAEAVRRHHANFFLALAEDVEPKINGGERNLWLERLEREHDNLRAALRWAADTAEAEMGLRLGGALFWFWFHRGYWSEGRRWLEGALATEGGAGAPLRTVARTKALFGTGVLAWTQGDHSAARTQLEESVAIWRELGDKRGLAHTLHFLGVEVLGQGEHVAARALAQESVEIFREGEDTWGLAASLASLGIVAQTQEDYSLASSLLGESAALFRGMGDAWGLALPLRNLGIVALRQGDLDRAAAWLREGITTLRELGEKWFMSRNLETLAAVIAMQGDHERAARLFGTGETLREAIGASVLPFYRADYDRGVAAARTGLDEQTFTGAWAQGRAMTLEQALSYALEEAPKPQEGDTSPPAAEMAPSETRTRPCQEEEEEGVHPPTPGAAHDKAKAPPEAYPEGLTAREAEVLGLLAGGKTNREIAQELVLSVSTIQRHVANVYAKIGARGRAEATAYALSRGIVTQPRLGASPSS